MPSEVEIGVWVEGVQKWVTGVTRRTSCHDIIKALLRAQSLPAQDSDVNDYVIVERWRKVERPLDHEQRILKVWKTWGEAINEVRFTLRQIRADGSDSETGSRMERSRRRHKWRQAGNGSHSKGAISQGPSQGANLKKAPGDDSKVNDTMERLMRLVVAQGETIQTQLRRMQERDQQIENFEQQLHLLRVQNLGSDYLLQSYLKEPSHDYTSAQNPETQLLPKDELLCEEKSNDSGVVTEEIPEADVQLGPSTERPQTTTKPTEPLDDLEDVKARTALLDKFEHVLVSLLQHEEAMARLEETLTESAAFEMAQLEDQIAESARAHALTVSCARQNEQKLRELDTVLLQRRATLEALLEEDLRHEEETLALQAHLDYIIHLPPTAFKLPPDDDPPPSRAKTASTSSSSKSSVPPLPPKSLPPPPPPPSLTVKTTPTLKPPNQKTNLAPSILKVAPKGDERIPSIAPSLKSPPVRDQPPPPLPSSSPPPLDEDDDKDSGKTNSLCVSSRSSTSSDTSSGGVSPCEGLRRPSKPVSKSSPSTESAKDLDSADSNSDTGLSSLHSSSDEGAYVLDTLV